MSTYCLLGLQCPQQTPAYRIVFFTIIFFRFLHSVGQARSLSPIILLGTQSCGKITLCYLDWKSFYDCRWRPQKFFSLTHTLFAVTWKRWCALAEDFMVMEFTVKKFKKVKNANTSLISNPQGCFHFGFSLAATKVLPSCPFNLHHEKWFEGYPVKSSIL